MSLVFELFEALLELCCTGDWWRGRRDRSIVGESAWDRDAKCFKTIALLVVSLIAGALWAVGSWQGWW